MSWPRAVSPQRVMHEPSVTVLEGALLTPSARGALHAVGHPHVPRRWMSGAVHDSAGRLITSSVRMWAGDRMAPVAVDPEVVALPGRVEELAGAWRYAGHWTRHFGHFFLEVLPMLWGEPPEQVCGLVMHRSPRADDDNGSRRLRAPRPAAWQAEFLALAGWRDPEIRVVHHRAARVERLVVASRPTVLKAWAAPEAVAVWRRVSDAVGARGTARRVFLSRSRFHADDSQDERSQRSHAAWDELLDARFAAAGFLVVHPEEIPLQEQIALVRGCDVLAGASGSALHLAAFARPGTHVLEIGDQRSPEEPLPTQRMVDAACEHRSRFVRFGDSDRLDIALGTLPV